MVAEKYKSSIPRQMYWSSDLKNSKRCPICNSILENEYKSYLLAIEGEKNMYKEEVFEKIASLLKSHGVRKVAVFGSYVRGEEKSESDIDIIVEFSERKSLLQLVRIERELSEELGIKVDLLTEKSISPYLIDTIKREMRVIYG